MDVLTVGKGVKECLVAGCGSIGNMVSKGVGCEVSSVRFDMMEEVKVISIGQDSVRNRTVHVVLTTTSIALERVDAEFTISVDVWGEVIEVVPEN